jgi:hypothetical protein
MKSSIRTWVSASLLAAGLATTTTISRSSAGAGTEVATPPGTVSAPTARYSSGIADIVKMADAKVDAEVLKAYIKDSPVAYNPSASEIIALTQRGVPADVLTVLLQRGGELRAQAATISQPPYVPATPPPQAPAPDYNYDYAPAQYPVDSSYYPAYGYDYPDYGYYNYGWYNYGYPWPFYSSVFIGYDAFGHPRYRHYGFDHGHSGSAHSGQPWQPARSFASRSTLAGRSFASGTANTFRAVGGGGGRGVTYGGAFGGRSGTVAVHASSVRSGGGSAGRAGGRR